MPNLSNNMRIPGFEHVTIMIVEDEEPFRKLISKIVEKYLGASVIECPNPKVAFEQLSKKIPDLIIMDLQMPVMDGLTAVKYIRAAERTSKIPIIICSALGFESVLKSMTLYNVADFIVKPADAQVIIKKIIHVLNQNSHNSNV
ncbi:MAG: response regulator [Candidatus Kapabacteria bacterium]|nr:response regulator [Ignavibacteriota bacterium]MCW5883709.1 response regulator [Candidatus Kapabacteria bacterium]